jgi:anti-sigma factor RsiW
MHVYCKRGIGMDDRKERVDEKATWATTDAQCTDESVGELLGDYLFAALTPETRAVFEEHLDDCVACFTAVTNWENISPTVDGQPNPAESDQANKARSFKAGS